MPWTVDDVERHNKGLTDKQKRQWVHVANGALESGDDDGTAITKANGVVKKDRIKEHIEVRLRAKAEAMLEAMVLQQIASIFEWKKDFVNGCKRCGKPTSYLMDNKECMRCYQSYAPKEKKSVKESVDLQEADPLPRVEKDINGKPVVPNKAQYHQYFSDMHHEHIKAHLKKARERWAQAAKDHEAAKTSGKSKSDIAHAAAHLKAVKAELSTGQSVLRAKTGKLKKKRSMATKKIKQQSKGNQGLIKAGTTALFGKSRLGTSVAKHITKHLLQGKLDKLNKDTK
jgi:uncharacterized protein YdaT